MLDKLWSRAARHPNWALALVTLAVLLPFLAKPFNIDDPLFIWAGRQIHAHPGNPYGFNVEWGWREFAMARVTENPPLACYYIALSATVLGWNEAALHFAFLLPAIAVILGTYRLASHLCRFPGLAALATLFTPVFLVSANTVMCDVLMLAFWVWAITFWLEGMEQKSFRLLAASGILAGLAALSKYYGLCLVPLLAAHGLIFKRRAGVWGLSLLIPVAAICVYQWVTSSLYGTGLLGAAAHYASFAKEHYGVSKVAACLVALAFTGGCVATALIFTPLIWRRKTASLCIVALFVIVSSLLARDVMQKYPGIEGSSRIFVQLQIAIWALGGLSVMAMAVTNLLRGSDEQSWLLALWIGGTFVFAALVNWTVNGRSILPMAPAVAILIARSLEQRPFRPRVAAGCLAVSAILSVLVAASDFSLARAVRQLSEKVAIKYVHPAESVWFQGHWGFQFYLQNAGASPMDFKSSPLKPGDIMVVPSNNTNLRALDPATSTLLDTFTAAGLETITTMDEATGAGFYSSVWGPLPFAFGKAPPEKASVYRLKPLSGSPVIQSDTTKP